MATEKQTNGRTKGFIRKPRQRRVLIVSDWQEESMMEAIANEAMRLDWQIMDIRFLHNLSPAKFNPDGILCCQQEIPAFVPTLRKSGVPTVRIWRIPKYSPDTDIPTVGYDASASGRLVATHFLERGFRQVCRLSWLSEHQDGPEDLISQSLQKFLEENGARYLGETHLPTLEEDGRQPFNKGFKRWLETMPRPLGVLTSGDILGGHVVAACHEYGVTVPEEIAVMGMGHKRRWCKMSPCPLSSLDWNHTMRGREAAQLLQNLMDGTPAPRDPILVPPAGIVARQSTDILAVEDVAVAKAISFLWKHLTEPISVDDAAEATGLSRSTLERRFRKQIGRSVNEELLRKRLERCRELLLSTDLPMAEIAPQLGFLSKNYLHRAFRKYFGCSPREFRQRHRVA
jgi:LacI family transcriptional regulator